MLTIEQHIQDLDTVNYQIAELKLIKEKIESIVLELAGRATFNEAGEIIKISREGERSEIQGKWKLTIKTDYTYNINKEEYEIIKNIIPSQYNPIRITPSYSIDKRLMREAEKYASNEELAILSGVITKKISKPVVKFSLNT